MEGAGANTDGRGDIIAVFIADDKPEMRELVRFGLEGDPRIQVVGEASTGRAAILGTEASRPHAVVLDLSMPDMDGFQAILEIRSRHPTVAIVVLSGFPADRMATRVIDQGGDAYLEKGTSLTELRELISRLVAERRSAERRAA